MKLSARQKYDYRDLVVCPLYSFTDQPPSFFLWAGWIRV